MSDICKQCGNEYERIAQHWSLSSDCSTRQPSEIQKEVITGILMGDGTVNRQKISKPFIKCSSITVEYLEYLDDLFGVFGNGVHLQNTAEELYERNEKSGFNTNSSVENYHDFYVWRSMSHEEFEEFTNWYKNGEKVWPDDIEITPIVLKHWYCGDGTINKSHKRSAIQIAMNNEIDNTEKVSALFSSAGLPTPSNYTICKRSEEHVDCTATFTQDQSEELFEYMGDPLPGFEYKWPKKYK